MGSLIRRMRIEQLDLSEWGDKLPPEGHEVFHRPEALAVLADRTFAERLRSAGLRAAGTYDWQVVRGQWFHVYCELGGSAP